MNLSYVLSPLADQDIDEIITYIAAENPDAADTFVDELYSAFDTLSDHPDMGHRRADIIDADVRLWPFKWHYLVIYRPKNPLEIVRVASGYRDIPNMMLTMKNKASDCAPA